MARKRTRKPKLPRLFDDSRNVIAIIDDEFEVIYANECCCRWLDISHDQIIGCRLKYASNGNPDPTFSKADGICPPPEIFQSNEPFSNGFVFTNNNSAARTWKRASFMRLSESASDVTTVVIVADEVELKELPVPDNSSLADSMSLHQTLAQLQICDQRTFTRASLVGDSDYTKKLRRQVEAVSANQSDCLIVGQPGSGREHLARTVFFAKDLSNARLIPIHCAIADGQTIQNSIKEWVFEQRENRTEDWLLLLDVDHLNPEAQVELLGYTQLPNFHLRLIATAEHDLMESPAAATPIVNFIQPLAMHLSVQVIHIEPLENRKQDIPLLTQYFVEQNNLSIGKQVGGFSNEVLELFHEYPWPRNIDELQQVVDAAFVDCDSHTIEVVNLPESFRHSLTASRIGRRHVNRIQLPEYLANIERELIERAMQQSHNNKTKAADLLSISRAKLLRRGAALGLIANETEKTSPDTVDESAFKEAE